MDTFVTLTSKGQLTLPAHARRALQLRAGDKLRVRVSTDDGLLTMSKPEGIEELSARISSYIRPGTKPVRDVDAYYQANRGKVQ